jgi:predicted NBD/HSP70 family sugar kinase
MPQKTIRHYNAARIFHSVRAFPGATQREIVELSGADKTTVNTVIRGFEQANLVKRIERAPSGGRGRPSEGYVISEDGGLLVGVHPRPEEIRFVVSGLSGVPTAVLSRPPPSDVDELGKAMAAGIRGLVMSSGRRTDEIRAVGISIPGIVLGDGTVEQSPNLHWSGFNPLELLAREGDFTAFVGNNADGITLAEALLTGMPSQRSFVLLLSGSGVGGGIVNDGELLCSATGLTGEFGHMKVERGGRLCECGGRGCLNAYTTNYALVDLIKEAGVNVETFMDVVNLAKQGDGSIKPVLVDYVERLAHGIANIIQVTGIADIVLGGGFGLMLPMIEADLRAAISRYALPSVVRHLKLSVSLASSVEKPVSGIAIALEGCTGMQASDFAPWAPSKPAERSPSKQDQNETI